MSQLLTLAIFMRFLWGSLAPIKIMLTFFPMRLKNLEKEQNFATFIFLKLNMGQKAK